MPPTQLSLSIIIPAYNEADTVALVVEQVLCVDLPGVSRDVLLINDGSTDGTGEVIDQLALKHDQVRAFHQLHNQGKGAAVRRGIQEATGEYVLIQDADLELSPTEYPLLLQPVQESGAVVVFGSRFLNAPQVSRGLNYGGNRFLTGLTNLLYGSRLTDMATAYKLVQRSILSSIPLVATGFELEPELTAKLLRRGHSIVEVPVTYSPRTREEGKKISWKHGFIYVRVLWRYRRFQG